MLSRIMWYYLASMRSHTLPEEEAELLLRRRLRILIEYSYANIPYYHEMMDNLGLKPSDIQRIEDLRKLLPLTREGIAANYQKILNHNLRPAIFRSTTGTTGKSLRVAYSSRSMDICNALKLRRNKILGTSFFDRTAWIAFQGFDAASETGSSEHGGEFMFSLRRIWRLLFGSFFTKDISMRVETFGLHNQNVGRVSQELLSFKPDILHSRPSYLRRLTPYLQEQGKALHPKMLLLEGEHLSNGVRRDLAAHFQADVFDLYGAREFGSLGFECPSHSGLHLNSDYYLFEFLHNGEPASEGELAEVLITGLHNEAMPLIRYKIGDIVVPAESERCECGSNLVRLKSIDGRISDGLVSSNGERISAGHVIEFLESVLNIRNYQLIQQGPFIFELKIAADQTTQEHIEDLTRYLKEKVKTDPDLRLQYWDEGEMPIKYRPVFSKVLERSAEKNAVPVL